MSRPCVRHSLTAMRRTTRRPSPRRWFPARRIVRGAARMTRRPAAPSSLRPFGETLANCRDGGLERRVDREHARQPAELEHSADGVVVLVREDDAEADVLALRLLPRFE